MNPNFFIFCLFFIIFLIFFFIFFFFFIIFSFFLHFFSFFFIFLSFSLIFLHFLSFSFIFFLSFSFIFFVFVGCSNSDFFLGLNFVTISLHNSNQKFNFSARLGVPPVRPLFLFFSSLFFFPPFFILFFSFSFSFSFSAIVVMFLRSKRLPDHNQVRDPCWGSRCADTPPRPGALGIQANLPAQSAQAARGATLALAPTFGTVPRARLASSGVHRRGAWCMRHSGSPLSSP